GGAQQKVPRLGVCEMPAVDSNKLRELNAALEELAQRRRVNRIEHFAPYPKQLETYALGKTHRERLLLAANQAGKSLAAGFELAYHLTGRYPDWWPGRRFTGPIRAWSMSVTAEATRDNMQRILLGALGARGTGTIPLDCIGEVRAGRGVGDVVDTVLVQHVSGYNS